MEKKHKTPTSPQKDNLKAEREQRGEMTPPESATDQRGATEQQVQPLTPPMAKSHEQPGDPERGNQPDKGLDPADELTPG